MVFGNTAIAEAVKLKQVSLKASRVSRGKPGGCLHHTITLHTITGTVFPNLEVCGEEK